jgi:hypothetical protein
MIIRVLDEKKQIKIANAQVNGHIIENKSTIEEKSRIITILEAGNTDYGGEVLYPLTINEEGKFVVNVEVYKSEYRGIKSSKKDLEVKPNPKLSPL